MREMTSADLDAVLAIEQSVQRYPWTRGQFADSLDAGHWCHVDEEGGELRGYAIMMPAVDEVELLMIGVSAAHQRKGLGRAMLGGMLELARGRNMRRVLLEVRPSNTAAVALYRSAGFSEVGLRRSYYRDANGSEDALVMACELLDGTNGAGEANG
ncbi:MAG: ribosomal protein S18-alanine N-acetyltransferase [Gallionella sp.]|jgi:ribosomal-protein-alanine N-acetyltransferase|nr:ribosomal protein S18-alanine N-acetyltransferase [Gallionella sp.]MCK9354369.1 ribosomal protein S18-alanine N-acetyltransferase [Gallionella sp.]